MKSALCIITIILTIPLCFGCTKKSPSDSQPSGALFCKNISENVQTIQQLNLPKTSNSNNNDNVNDDNTNTTNKTENTDDIQYGMWFPAMDYSETLSGKTKDEFQNEMSERFKNAADIGINTIYLHVRAFGDAYYNSDLFSPGLYEENNIDFDPLECMIETAHKLNLSVHAWINPLRCQTEKQMQSMDNSFLIKQWYDDSEKNGTVIVNVNGQYWLNPAYPEVRQLISDGVSEIVNNYDVDGIHIDDYFYPTKETYFDEEAFEKSGETDLNKWRKSNCSEMVKAMYDATKTENKNVLFGISPQGTLDGNENQYSDVQMWCNQSGYCDYIVPQIYFGFENDTAPFQETVDMWENMITCEDVKLSIGICTYKIGKIDTWAGEGKNEWIENTNIPTEEIEFITSKEKPIGISIYDYSSTFLPEDNVKEAMATQVENFSELLSKK